MGTGWREYPRRRHASDDHLLDEQTLQAHDRADDCTETDEEIHELASALRTIPGELRRRRIESHIVRLLHIDRDFLLRRQSHSA
jgi:hypothetical protein